MNAINSIRFDVNLARHDNTYTRRKLNPDVVTNSATVADKKNQSKTYSLETQDEFNSRSKQKQPASKIVLADSKYYRSNLLGEIYNKMSGVEAHSRPGFYVEYYA